MFQQQQTDNMRHNNRVLAIKPAILTMFCKRSCKSRKNLRRKKNKWDLSVNVIDYEKVVAEDAARKSRGIPFIMDGDPELKAYVSQLAVELGISKNEKTFQHGLPKWFDFAKDLQELLDEGLISREDIINAVKSPPKVHYNNGYDDKDGFGVELNFDDFENTKPIEYASALELFEMLWGKEKGVR
jgi:hypothetical protein